MTNSFSLPEQVTVAGKNTRDCLLSVAADLPVHQEVILSNPSFHAYIDRFCVRNEGARAQCKSSLHLPSQEPPSTARPQEWQVEAQRMSMDTSSTKQHHARPTVPLRLVRLSQSPKKSRGVLTAPHERTRTHLPPKNVEVLWRRLGTSRNGGFVPDHSNLLLEMGQLPHAHRLETLPECGIIHSEHSCTAPQPSDSSGPCSIPCCTRGKKRKRAMKREKAFQFGV